MAIIPASTTLSEEYSQAVPLALYAQTIGYDECAFWGVARTDSNGVACHDPCFAIMRKWERDKLRRYLREAQDEIEQITRYPLAPRYIEAERIPWRTALRTRWLNVIEMGVMATTDIGAAAVVDATADPLVYTIAAPAGVTDTTEIHIYHPDTDSEISPSAVAIEAGTITITIPRCRAIISEDNPSGGWDYDDDTLFEDEIDVVRIYTDSSDQATIYCKPDCDDCDPDTKTACVHIKNYELGTLTAYPAEYVDDSFSRECWGCCCPESVIVNYRAGMNPTSKQAVDAIIRLAHAKAPTALCDCTYIQQVWKRDRETPEVLTAERLNNPFGYSDGAMVAVAFANAMRKVRGATL